MNRKIEQQAADILLDAGISVPLLRLKVPWWREFVLRVTMSRPCLGAQIRIVRQYLALGVTAAQIDAFDEKQEMEFFAKHGRRLSLMLALTICQGYLSGLLLAPMIAWLIRWRVSREYQLELQKRFRQVCSTRDFTNIIAWTEVTNPFQPRASRATVLKRIKVATGGS